MARTAKHTRGSRALFSWLRTSGTTKRVLAGRLNVTESIIYLWSHGKSVPMLLSALALERETGVSVQSWAEPETTATE
ncbi:MAG TPA: hypothetical protein VGL81_31535 [Polyangiaceae bacterium]